MLDLLFGDSLDELPVDAVAVNYGLHVAEQHHHGQRTGADDHVADGQQGGMVVDLHLAACDDIVPVHAPVSGGSEHALQVVGDED